MLEHRRMLRRLVPVLLTVSLGAIPLGAGCMRAGAPGPASPQPIRDEKEPGESLDTVSAVPDSGSTGVEEMTSGSSENEVEIDEGDSASKGNTSEGVEGEKSAGKSDDQPGDDDGGEDETGDEPDDPSDIDVGSDDP
jgi:hypothetical protein